jgi:hypothetical protein
VINGTAKIVEGQVTREPDLSDNFSVETADSIPESSLKSMSKKATNIPLYKCGDS